MEIPWVVESQNSKRLQRALKRIPKHYPPRKLHCRMCPCPSITTLTARHAKFLLIHFRESPLLVCHSSQSFVIGQSLTALDPDAGPSAPALLILAQWPSKNHQSLRLRAHTASSKLKRLGAYVGLTEFIRQSAHGYPQVMASRYMHVLAEGGVDQSLIGRNDGRPR